YVTVDVVHRLGLPMTPLPHTKTVGTEDGTLHGVSTSYCIVSFTAGRRVSENITLDIIHLEMDEMVLGNFYLTTRQGYMIDDRSGVELRLRHNWRI
ncbi:hypothetical protein KI387_004174, partial [Taxus chinensis]